MDDKKPVPVQTIIVVIVILLALGAGYWYWSQKGKEGSVVETAKDISASVPEIQTNPGEKVPEVNPLDLANPFKYTNPLR